MNEPTLAYQRLARLDFSFTLRKSVHTRGSKQHIIIVLSPSPDNGHMGSTIGKKLNLSAGQCSKRVVLNKLALEGEFP